MWSPDLTVPEALRQHYRGLVRNGQSVRLEDAPVELSAEELERLRAALRDETEQAAGEAAELAERLKRLLSRFDPVHLLTQLAVAMLSGDPADPADGERYGREAVIELLTGAALAHAPWSQRTAPPAVVQRAWDMAKDIIGLELKRLLCSPPPPGEPEVMATAQFLLRIDELTNRTNGYASHQEEMLRATFAPLRSECMTSLGFDPADIPAVIRAIHALAQDKIRPALDGVAQRAQSSRALAGDPNAVADVLAAVAAGSHEWLVFSAADIAERAALEQGPTLALLESLSCRPGCQPQFARPGRRDNRALIRPVVALGDGRYFCASVWAPLHEFVAWFIDLCREQGLSELESRFLRARDRAAESLARERLASVFGGERVHGPLLYDTSDGQAELDALVGLPGAALVVEAKAHHLTDPARRGAPGRVRRHTQEIVDKALAQGARAAEHLASGQGGLTDARTGVPIDTSGVSSVTRIAVSFDRVDALALVRGMPAERRPEAWIVAVADLLMVCDVLRDPAELFAYVRARARFTRDEVALGFMEADLLAVWLADRLRGPRDLIDAEPDAQVMVGFHAEGLNAYFTQRDLGLGADRPATGVPDIVLAALNELLAAGDHRWALLADAVMGEPAAAWPAFRAAWKRVRAQGRRRQVATEQVETESGLCILALAGRGAHSRELLIDAVREADAHLGIAHERGPQAGVRAVLGERPQLVAR